MNMGATVFCLSAVPFLERVEENHISVSLHLAKGEPDSEALVS